MTSDNTNWTLAPETEPLPYATVTGVYRTDRAAPNPYASGYGRKIPTRYTVTVAEASGAYRKVWAVCFSNVASYYVIVGNRRLWLRDSDLYPIVGG